MQIAANTHAKAGTTKATCRRREDRQCFAGFGQTRCERKWISFTRASGFVASFCCKDGVGEERRSHRNSGEVRRRLLSGQPARRRTDDAVKAKVEDNVEIAAEIGGAVECERACPDSITQAAETISTAPIRYTCCTMAARPPFRSKIRWP